MTTVAAEVGAGRRSPAAGTRPGRAPSREGPVEVFERERSTLLAIAARILGSAREADDVVQDAFIRWQGVDHGSIRNPAAFLTRVTTRLSINAVKAAHRRRMEYVGDALPEPEPAATDAAPRDPLAMQETTEELTRAFGLILERLTPVERAVFLLHECFGYSYAEIAPIVGKTEDNCRQIEKRARQHLAGRRHPRSADPAERERLFGLFLRAAREGDLGGLVGALSRGAAAYAAAR